MKVGEALVRLLEAYEVDTIFGIPGTHSLELYRGLAKSSIRHISPRHEQGGGFMADGYARSSGKPGVCFVITGPGVTNITTPLGEAYMDSVPLLVISPVNTPDPSHRNIGRLHEITDQAAVTAPLTASSPTANNAEDIPDLVARAFAVFASQRPRPVHISIPLPVLAQDVAREWRVAPVPGRPAASKDQIAECARLLDGAVRPVIFAGGGARFASSSVLGLAEKLGAPLITSVAGRGIIPGDHPLYPGAQLSAALVRNLFAEADVALLLGTELAQTEHFCDSLRLPELQIRVNLDPGALMGGNQSMGLLADVGPCVDSLRDLVAVAPKERRQWAESSCENIRNAIPVNFTPKNRIHMGVLEAIERALPADAFVVSDMTQIAYTAVEYLPWSRPGAWLHPTGYGTLGYALPAAIGAKIAAPQSKIVVLVGDAGLQYTLQEMSLATELGLDLVVILWNNDRLLQINDDMDAAGITPVGVEQRNPDFLMLARAYGWESSEANGVEEFAEQLRVALGREGRPSLIKLNERALC